MSKDNWREELNNQNEELEQRVRDLPENKFDEAGYKRRLSNGNSTRTVNFIREDCVQQLLEEVNAEKDREIEVLKKPKDFREEFLIEDAYLRGKEEVLGKYGKELEELKNQISE